LPADEVLVALIGDLGEIGSRLERVQPCDIVVGDQIEKRGSGRDDVARLEVNLLNDP